MKRFGDELAAGLLGRREAGVFDQRPAGGEATQVTGLGEDRC
jgi:hypothetical protein